MVVNTICLPDQNFMDGRRAISLHLCNPTDHPIIIKDGTAVAVVEAITYKATTQVNTIMQEMKRQEEKAVRSKAKANQEH